MLAYGRERLERSADHGDRNGGFAESNSSPYDLRPASNSGAAASTSRISATTA